MAKVEHSSEQADILEQGNIYFLYRPQVEETDPDSVRDVQQLYMVLKPDGGLYRLIVIGQKHLPDVGQHEQGWAFLEALHKDPAKLEKGLRQRHYQTKTRGERVEPAVRPAGEGLYTIANIEDQAHLIYALELPRDTDEVQKQLHIASEASFALSIKNPEKTAPPVSGLKPDQRADYPQAQQDKFRERRFDSEHPQLLDYEGAEMVLIGARENPEQAYGVDLDTDQENSRTADILRDLRMAKSRHPLEPLLEGEWR